MVEAASQPDSAPEQCLTIAILFYCYLCRANSVTDGETCMLKESSAAGQPNAVRQRLSADAAVGSTSILPWL